MTSTTVFLVSNNQFPLNLQKLSPSLYYSPTDKSFYRLNVMPSCTLFANQQVQKRQIMTLNKIDPLFLMISELFAKRKIFQENLPYQGLKHNKNWEIISNVEQNHGKTVYTYSKQKIFDFLEKKVAKMENYLYQHNPLDRIKLLQLEEKNISNDTIILLKNQLSHDLVNQLIRQRYNHQQNRKRAPEIEQTEATKPKPTKNKKAQQKVMQKPKNQPTLFSSWGKK